MTTQLKFTADDHLERRLEREQSRRGSKTLAKTVRELAIERLTQIESAALVQPTPEQSTQPAIQPR